MVQGEPAHVAGVYYVSAYAVIGVAPGHSAGCEAKNVQGKDTGVMAQEGPFPGATGQTVVTMPVLGVVTLGVGDAPGLDCFNDVNTPGRPSTAASSRQFR